MNVSPERFEQIVFDEADAVLDQLSPALRAEAETVLLLVEDQPGPEHDPGERRMLLGLYEGVPLIDRHADSLLIMPDRITAAAAAMSSSVMVMETTWILVAVTGVPPLMARVEALDVAGVATVGIGRGSREGRTGARGRIALDFGPRRRRMFGGFQDGDCGSECATAGLPRRASGPAP